MNSRMACAALIAAIGIGAFGGRAVAAEAVGVRSITITDADRRDLIQPKFQRQWTVDIYYPATTAGTPQPYLADKALDAKLVEGQYYGQTAERLGSWATTPSPATVDAPQAAGSRPLVLIAPGLGVVRANYAYLASAFVRQGFVVAVIDLPYLGLQRLPDGRTLDAGDDPLAAGQDPNAYAPRIKAFVRDVAVTLDRLPASLRFDPKRVVMTGHSSGGTVAVDVCRSEPRVAACIDFEGGMEGSEAWRAGVTKPTLIGASRAKGRPENPPPPGQPDMFEQMRRAMGVAGNRSSWVIKITGGSHMSYSDAPVVMPDTITRFGGEVMSADRSMALYTAIVEAFAQAHWPGGGGDAAFEAFLKRQPEITRADRTGPS